MRHLPNSLENRLREVRKGGSIEVYERVDLKAWTGLGVGGHGDLLIRCSTASAVQQALDLLASHGTQWFTIGAGSRIVAPDRGFRVPLLNLTGELGRWNVGKNGVTAGGGAKLAQVCTAAARAGMAGLEGLANSPGSVGGVMASVAMRRPDRLGDIVEWIEQVRAGGAVVRIETVEDMELVRRELGRDRLVISGARFRTTGKNRGWAGGGIDPTRMAVGRHRSRTAARVFHDPAEGTALEHLELAGCAGLRVGGASVAEWSSNALVTTRVCTASDVTRLVWKMRDRVRDRRDVVLEPRLWLVDEQGRRMDE